jgi:hypothetical protein
VKPDARSRSARKYACGGERFAKLLKFAKLDAKLLEHNFSVLPKIDGCQVDLANSLKMLVCLTGEVATTHGMCVTLSCPRWHINK